MRTIKIESVSIKEAKNNDTIEAKVIITSKEVKNKKRGALIMLNIPALKLLNLTSRLTGKDKAYFLETTGTKAVEIGKSVAVINLNDYGYGIYNCTELSIEDVPTELRQTLSNKHTVRLNLSNCNAIFQHYDLIFGNSYEFKLGEFLLELPNGKQTTGYILEQPTLINETAKIIRKISDKQLLQQTKIKKWCAEQKEIKKPCTIGDYWKANILAKNTKKPYSNIYNYTR